MNSKDQLPYEQQTKSSFFFFIDQVDKLLAPVKSLFFVKPMKPVIAIVCNRNVIYRNINFFVCHQQKLW